MYRYPRGGQSFGWKGDRRLVCGHGKNMGLHDGRSSAAMVSDSHLRLSAILETQRCSVVGLGQKRVSFISLPVLSTMQSGICMLDHGTSLCGSWWLILRLYVNSYSAMRSSEVNFIPGRTCTIGCFPLYHRRHHKGGSSGYA